MTFIVGFECWDGLVLCSESQEGDGYNKRDVYKLRSFEINGEWGFGFGCAGTTPAINKFTDKFRQLVTRDPYDRAHTELLVEKTLQHIQEQYPREQIQIVAGIWGPGEQRIYKGTVDSHCIAVEDGYACAGMDVSLPRAIIESIYEDGISVDEALRLGVFVTAVAKSTLDGCGGPIRAKVYRVGTGAWEEVPEGQIIDTELEFPMEEVYGMIHQYWKDKQH